MEDILSRLDSIIKKTNPLYESKDVHEDIDPNYETKEQGIMAAAQQIAGRVFSETPPGGGGGGTEMGEVDDPIPSMKGESGEDGGGEGVDKTFKSTKMDDLGDLEDFDDEGGKEKEPTELEDEDFEFDDFDYDDSRDSGGGKSDEDDDMPKGGGSGSSGDDDDYEDGDFDDGELGDEDDYDFGDDDGDTGESGDDEGDEGDDIGEPGGGGGSGKGKGGEKHGGDSGTSGSDDGESGEDEGGEHGGDPGTPRGGDSKGKGGEKHGGDPGTDGRGKSGGRAKEHGGDPGTSGGSDGGPSSDDVDYDDTLDYDSGDDDSLESGIKDALDRIKEGADKKEKKHIDDLKKSIDEGEEEGKSSEDIAKDLEDKISDKKEKKSGSGELAGESLDESPNDESFEEDMKKAGFSDEDIKRMKSDKNTDPSSEIDDDRVKKEAVAELDRKAKKEGRPNSALSKSIIKSITKGELGDVEWREMVEVFLSKKSKEKGIYGKTKRNAYGDRKHLWREAVLPTKKVSGGGVDKIYCFVDFSGSVEQELVFSFLHRILLLCGELNFDTIKVYGFAKELSKPFEIKQEDVVKSDGEVEEFLEKMWDFISSQYLDGSYENFEEVADEINRIKHDDYDAPIFIFGDGLWAMSYDNIWPPKYLKEKCPSYLDDILVLIYYTNDYIKTHVLPHEYTYLKEVAGLEHIVVTGIKNLKKP